MLGFISCGNPDKIEILCGLTIHYLLTVRLLGFSCFYGGTLSMSSVETSTDVVEVELDAMTSNQ